MYRILPVVIFLLTGFPFVSDAHPGRTDSAGCHTCRTNCPNWGLSTGEYHCHRSKGVPQPLEPVRSIRSEQITVPAPEYKEILDVPTPTQKTKQIPVTATSTNYKSARISLEQKPIKQGFIKWLFGLWR